MYASEQELTLALSVEALERSVRAETSLRLLMDSGLERPKLLDGGSSSLLGDAIRHAVGLTILRMAAMVKSTDLDSGGEIVHIVMRVPKVCFRSEYHRIRHMVEDAVVACVMREWLDFDVPFDPLDLFDRFIASDAVGQGVQSFPDYRPG